MSHLATEVRCTASHLILPDDDGEACIMCDACGQFIRPHKMNDDCSGPDTRTMEERMLEMFIRGAAAIKKISY